MANKGFYKGAHDGTPKQICFADHAGDFGPAAANDLRLSTDGSLELDCQMALTGLASVTGVATTTGASASAKVDLGANRARAYSVRAAIELAATPTAGNVIEFWWAPSDSGTAANGNPGGISGTAANPFTGYSSNNDASLLQCQLIGTMICTAQATGTVQVAECGVFSPSSRYGTLIVRNKSGAAVHSDDVECNVVLTPILDLSDAA